MTYYSNESRKYSEASIAGSSPWCQSYREKSSIVSNEEVIPDAVKRMSKVQNSETMIDKIFMNEEKEMQEENKEHQPRRETRKQKEERQALELQRFYDNLFEKEQKAVEKPVVYAQHEPAHPQEDLNMSVKERLELRCAETESAKKEAVPIHFKENEEQLKKQKLELLALRKQIKEEQRFRMREMRKASNS